MCGQCAYIGPASSWSYEYFKLAALMQDVHGRDNAGFVHVLPSGEYDIAKCSPTTGSIVFDLFEYDQDHIVGSSLYELMCLNKDLPKQIEGNIVIAHSRKGSVGNDDIDMAQPLEIDCGEYKLLLTHNGTVYNYEEILECLSIDEPCNNDTHAIGLAIKHGKAKEFFSLINGTATCLWVRSDMPSTIFSCGITQDKNPKTNYPTRPLHFAFVGKAIYISREKSPISYIKSMYTNPDNLSETSTTYSIPANVIFSFYIDENGKADFSRIESFERDPLLPVKQHTKVAGFTHDRPKVTTTDEMVELLRGDRVPSTTSNKSLEYYQSRYYLNGEPITTPYTIEDNKVVIESQTYVSPEGYVVYKREGRYYFFSGTRYKGNLDTLTAHYFLDGIMIINRTAFELLLKDYPDMEFRPLDVAPYATHPVWVGAFNNFNYVSTKNLHHFLCALPINQYSDVVVNGKFTPIYSDKTYLYKGGKVFKIKTNKAKAYLRKLWAGRLMELKLYNNYNFKYNVNYIKGENFTGRLVRLGKAVTTMKANTTDEKEKIELNNLLNLADV